MLINQEKLKLQLKNRNVKKSDLTSLLGISSRTIAKIGKGEEIANAVVNKIAEFLGCEIKDIVLSNNILDILREEKALGLKGGLYHTTQIKLTYNSNHIEGSRLSEEQTRYIFETHTIGSIAPDISLDDIIETSNHFKCIDYVIENAEEALSEQLIKNIQRLLKQGTKFGTEYGVGIYKLKPNIVGEIETCAPENVPAEMKKLLENYNKLKRPRFEDIVEFHKDFETIHPFQDGNGRVGRLIAFKECLRWGIVPFYIDDADKWFYYRGLKQWSVDRTYLIDTCLSGQDKYKRILDYFKIEY